MQTIISFMNNLFTNQRGAMFGMDARIALIVASVLAATGGITIMSRLERNRVDAAERGAEILRAAVLEHYRTIGINQLPATLDEVFQASLVEDVTLKTDPWGSQWYYTRYSSNVELEGVPITIHYATIHSAGKDAANNSSIIATDLDYAEWQALNDDIGLKFSTRDIEVGRLEEYRATAQIIIDKLSNYESAAYLSAQAACDGVEQASWCNGPNGVNYTQFNYYPQSDIDQTDGITYYDTVASGKSPYLSGDINDMEQLMIDIGLPVSYAKDPWNRVLFYHSNITERSAPPFTASICFSLVGSCF